MVLASSKSKERKGTTLTDGGGKYGRLSFGRCDHRQRGGGGIRDTQRGDRQDAAANDGTSVLDIPDKTW